MESIRNLREKIEKLEKEKSSLLAEIENLEKRGEARVNDLENAVTTLRKEVKAFERLLNVKEKGTK